MDIPPASGDISPRNQAGVLAEVVLRIHCDACGYDRLVAFIK
jgi:hypothetical protein